MEGDLEELDFGHGCDLLGLEDAPGVGDIRLDVGHCPLLDQVIEAPFGEEAFPGGEWHG